MSNFINALIYMGFLLAILAFGVFFAGLLGFVLYCTADMVYKAFTQPWDPIIYWYLGGMFVALVIQGRIKRNHNEKTAVRDRMLKELGLPKDFEL